MGLRCWRVCALIAAGAGLLTAADDLEKRIDELLAKMTLEEKLGQMSQSTDMSSPLSAKDKDDIRKGRWGSYLNAASPVERAEAQRIALKESRLGIPLIFGRDVIHGYRTIFPIPLGQAASWDPDLVRQAARVAGREAASVGHPLDFRAHARYHARPAVGTGGGDARRGSIRDQHARRGDGPRLSERQARLRQLR